MKVNVQVHEFCGPEMWRGQALYVSVYGDAVRVFEYAHEGLIISVAPGTQITAKFGMLVLEHY